MRNQRNLASGDPIATILIAMRNQRTLIVVTTKLLVGTVVTKLPS